MTGDLEIQTVNDLKGIKLYLVDTSWERDQYSDIVDGEESRLTLKFDKEPCWGM